MQSFFGKTNQLPNRTFGGWNQAVAGRKSYVNESTMPSIFRGARGERKITKVPFSIQKGIIGLRNEQDFEDFVNYLKTQNLDGFEKQNQFISYRTSSDLENTLNEISDLGIDRPPLDDLHLATAINADGFIKVGRWLIRLIVEQKRCIVSQHFDDSTIKLMVTNPDSLLFRQFTFNDDVFGEIENSLSSGQSTHRIGCSDSAARCAGRCEESDKYDSSCYVGGCTNRYRALYSHAYHPYGIYHKLNAEFRYKRRRCAQLLYWPYGTNIDISYNARWTVRCAGSGNLIQYFLGNAITTVQYRWYNYKTVKVDYYSGSRALHQYIAYTSWKFLNLCGGPITKDLPFIQSQV